MYEFAKRFQVACGGRRLPESLCGYGCQQTLEIVGQITQCTLPIAGGEAEGGVDFAAV